MDQKVVNYIKSLAIDMIDNAGSGHPGMVLSAAPIIYSVYAYHLSLDTNNLTNKKRDRFVLSAGHGSALLYATLHVFGMPIKMADLKAFRQNNPKTAGHPEYDAKLGIENASGPLGQGVATAVGMAIAGKHQKLDNHIFALCGDGDLMEGVSYEALSLAGHLKLANLVLLYDANDITLDGGLDNAFSENIRLRMESMKFDYYLVEDGDDLIKLNETIAQAKKSARPAFVMVKTVIGKGTSVAGSSKAHGKPLGKEDITSLKQSFGINDCFNVPDDVYAYARKQLIKNQCASVNHDDLKLDLEIDLPQKKEMLTELRQSGGKILAQLKEKNPTIIGGSADVGSSTKMYVEQMGDFSAYNYQGRNIWYGVREHAMASITNGLTLTGMHGYCATFLVFADYMKPAIRLAALMNIPSVFIFSHDSVSVGPDGPTHQPVEQLAMLRSTPNLTVLRPADEKEVIGAWQVALTSKNPSAIVLSRGKVRQQRNTRIKKVSQGAYIVRKEKQLHGILIATGSEVMTAVQIANELWAEKKVDLRVVSMPSQELFAAKDKKYQARILPPGVRKVVIEAGSSYGWEGYVYNEKYLLTINSFGLSASSDEVLQHFKFDYDNLKKRVKRLFWL